MILGWLKKLQSRSTLLSVDLEYALLFRCEACSWPERVCLD